MKSLPYSPSFTGVASSIEALIDGSLSNLTQRFSFEQEDQLQHAELYATVVSEDTEQQGYLFVFRDRTEEERIDEMKNELISIVSHELRTPLASVLGFIEILLHRELSQEKQKKYMETINKEAHRLSNLINDFLDLQRMESGRQLYHFSPVNLLPTVKRSPSSGRISKVIVFSFISKKQNYMGEQMRSYSSSIRQPD